MLALLLLPCLLVSLTASQREGAQSKPAVHDGRLSSLDIPNTWIEYTPGTCNVVISSPHGGWLRPAEIPDRTHGCLADDGVTCSWEKGCGPADAVACRAVTGTDTNSQQVASMIVRHLSDTYNCVPHFVRANLHRSKLDPNRPIEEAAQGDPLSQAAWRAYHEEFMVTAVERVRAQFGRGLVFDIHGQAHAEQWTELGYT